MNLLFVAAGRLPIPPPGWGAVEKLLDEQSRFLNASGLARVDILNRRNPILWQFLQARPWKYDLVHLHDDSRIPFWTRMAKRFGFRLAVTTHDGYAGFPERWSERFAARFDAMRNADIVFALSPRIARVARERGFTNQIIVQPNGLFPDEVQFAPVAQKSAAIMLGKVDNRKRQVAVAEALRNQPVTCDIVGPLSTDVPLGWTGNGENVRYQGEWLRDDVSRRLTEYAALALLSDGEAHPLVVMEALAAGLSVVVSEEAGENVDADQPFVFRVRREDDAGVTAALTKAVATNSAHRAMARHYCEETFDWKVLLPRYIEQVRTNRL